MEAFFYVGHQSKQGCIDQESIQSSTTPDPVYQWEVTNAQLYTIDESQEISTFPAGDQKAQMNRRTQRHNNNKTEKNINDSQKKYRLGNS